MAVCELTAQPVIGKRYRVPCVTASLYGLQGDWPVIGSQHEDAEYIKFQWQHWHLDWRFMPEREYRYQVTERQVSPYGIVLLTKDGEEFGGAVNPAGFPKPVLRWRVCKRAWPEWPAQIPWRGELETAFVARRLSCALVCPHRGVPLASIAPDVDGNVVCPGHSLKWNVSTRRLVPQVLA